MHRKEFILLQRILTPVVDIFYPVFRKIMPQQVYRFLAIGGICFFLNVVIFTLSYHFFFEKYGIKTTWIPSYIFAYITSLSVTVIIGFYLNRIFVFHGSKLEKHIQFIRFAWSTVAGAITSYFLLQFFVEQCGLYPTIALIVNVAIIQTFNYFIQKNYSFKY